MAGPITSGISIRTLYYESNDIQFDRIRGLLAKHSVKVRQARSLVECHEILDNSFYHAILVDGDRATWCEAIHDLLRRQARTPILLVTMGEIRKEHIRAISKGAQDVVALQKSSPLEIAIRIKFAIERQGLRLDRRLFDESVEMDQTGEHNVLGFREAAEKVKIATNQWAHTMSLAVAKGS